MPLLQNKWIRRLAWTFAALAGLVALAWLAVPPLVKSQAEKIASAQLGRKVTLGAVEFKPLSLELTLHDLAVATQDGSNYQLRIKRVYANVAASSLLRLAPVIDAIAIDVPSVRLTHLGGGRYDTDDIVATLQARATPPEPNAKPAEFALYNIALTGGAVEFIDKAAGKSHKLTGLTLGLPFLSNLPSQREVKVEPKLAFTLNGSAFDSAAQTTPFAQTRKTDASVRIKALDLAPYLPYWPASLPVRLESAVLQADLRVAFEQAGAAHKVVVSGLLGADKVRILAPAGKVPLLAFDSLRLQSQGSEPLAQHIHLASVELASPTLEVVRDKSGRINLTQLGASSPNQTTTKIIATKRLSTLAPADKDVKTSSWKLEIDSFKLNEGSVQWRDETTAPQAALALSALQLEAKAIAWPFSAPLTFTGAGQLAGSALRFGGSATDQQASVTASFSALPLAVAAPYLAPFLEPRLAGKLSAELAVGWNAGALK